MKLGAAFPSKWLKSEDCEDEDLVLTIRRAEMEDVQGQGSTESKLVLHFDETDKGLIVNKTNGKAVAKLHGDDTDDWLGKRIALYATEVEFGGETMLGIRVRLKAPKAGPAPAATGAARPKAGATTIPDADDEDDVPF
jgi:hypothetical protein